MIKFFLYFEEFFRISQVPLSIALLTDMHTHTHSFKENKNEKIDHQFLGYCWLQFDLFAFSPLLRDIHFNFNFYFDGWYTHQQLSSNIMQTREQHRHC